MIENENKNGPSFIKDCLLFRSKDDLYRFMGLWLWINIIHVIIIIAKIFYEK